MEETKEVSNIQDEDVLRRMWQATEDFSRKKEIRAHMYKLREARLKEFYSSGEVLRDVQRSNSSPGLCDQLPLSKDQGPTHADSLADHSFMSLKTKEWQATEDFSRKKEIRAHMYKLREARLKEFYSSGEVLRDVQRSNSSPGLRDQLPLSKDQGPTHADSLADHSFMSLKTKEVRDSESPTRDVQFRNSKNRDVDGQWTITSSSSTSPDGKSFTSSQRATTQGMRPVDGGQLTYAAANEHQASVFTDGDDRNFTRSLGEASKTFAEENVVSGDDNNFRKSKTTTKSTSSRVVTESRSQSGDFNDQQLAITTGDEVDNTAFKKSTVKYTSGDIPEDLKKSIADGSTKVFTETKTLPDGSTVTTTRYETKSTKKVGTTDTRRNVDRQNVTDGNYKTIVTKTVQEPTVSKSSHVTSSRQTVQEYDTNIDDGSYQTVVTKTVEVDTKPSRTVQEYDTNIDKTIVTKIIREPTVSTKTSSRQTVQTDDDTNANYKTVVTKTVREVETYPIETFEVTNNRQVVHKSTDNTTDKANYKTVATKTIRETDFDDRQNVKQTENKNVTTTIVREVDDHRKPVVTKSVESPTVETIVTKTTVTETKKPDSPTKSSPSKQSPPPKSCKPQETYHPSSPTEGQYSTTYKSEFTNKKISVEVSATHDAFARSLRSITPDRLERPKSRGSISSLRSSTSPEKHSEIRSPDRKHNVSPCRQSPERKQYSPEKKQYSPERKQYSPERKQYSPERKPSRPDSITITRTTETITKRRGSDKKSPTSPVKTSATITKSPIKSPVSPTTVRSPVSPTKDSPRKKPTDNERKSPVRSPSKTTEINTDTITRKKKLPTDENKSPDDRSRYTTVDSTTITRNRNTPTTIEITINSDTITRKQKTPTDDLKTNKTCTTEIINTDTITRSKKKPETNGDTITRKQKPEKVTTDIDEQIVTEAAETKRSISRDLSQTSLASDIEFINHNRHIVTDLDEPLDDKPGKTEKRPSTLEVTETVVTNTKVTSPTKSPVKSKSPTKEHPNKVHPKGHPTSPVKEVPTLKNSPVPELSTPDKPPTNFNIEDFDQVCEVTPKERPPLRRTETYEERCRQMLGLPEPDEIIKKDYDDMYAGMEPVDEPLFVKKNVTPLGPIGPDDYVIHDSVKKINKRKEEIPDDVKDNIEEFIIKEQIEIVDAKPRDNKKSPERKSPEKSSPERKSPDQKVIKSPVQKSASPDRKSPRNKLPTDGQYNTEYTDEYCDRPTRVTTTKTIKITDKKPSRESSPTKTIDNLDKKPKDVSPKKDTTTKTPKVTSRESSPKKDYTTTRTVDSSTKTTKVSDRKPSRDSITTTKTTKVTDTKVNEYNKSPRRPSKGSPERKPKQEFTTEYTEEYCEITDKKVTKKPGKQPTSPKKTQKPVDSSDDEQPKKKTDRFSPSRTLPENVTVTQYINNTKHDNDFISKEKHDTDINLTTKNIVLNLETENVQETHVRTHRIDTKPGEVSPKRVPQKAVPSDTIECTFKKPDTKKTPVTDRKSPVKQLKDKKDSCTKIVTKKVSSTDISISRTTPKKSPEIQKKPSSTCITRKPSDNPQKTVPKSTSVPSKHIVTKTISVKTKPSTKPATKPATKPKDNDTSDSEAEIEIIKKKVTNGTVNVTLPSYKVNTTEQTKCVTIKSIILNNEPDLEIPIGLQRSTSSREPSPEKICPIPVSDDEGGHPRYPDQVSEPDDVPFRRPTKISDIPLTEEENVEDFNRITEVNKKITDIDMVTETDESLLSVTEKVTKFITTSEKLIENKPKSPAPKVPRPELVVDEHLENDECLLSVSDKVSKFITTAEQIQTPERPKSPRPKSPRPKDRSPVDVKVNENDECLLSVNEKVSHFITAAETSKKTPTRDGPAPKVARPDFKVDETFKTDECLLSVSDKVNKFLTSAEKLTTNTVTRQSPERSTPTRRNSSPNRREPIPSRRDSTSPTRQKSPEKMSPKREPSPIKKTPDLVRKTPDLVRRSPEKTPELRRKSPERTPEQLRISPERTPDLVRKFPTSEPKSVNLKSSEAVKKAKAMFENISKNQEAPKQRDILSRPSIWEGRKKPDVVDKPEDDVKLTDIGVYTLKSTKLILNESKLSPEKDIPGYMRPTRARSPNPICKPEPEPVQKPEQHIQKPEEHTQRPRYLSPEKDIPGYMRPTRSRSPNPICKPEPEPVHHIQKPEEQAQRPRYLSPEKDIPGYMRPTRSRSPNPICKPEPEPVHHTQKPEEQTQRPRYLSPEKDIPGYMRPIRSRSPNPICKPEPEPVHHIQKPEEQLQNPDLPGYMRPIAKVSPKERDQIILETRYRETTSPEREIVKKSVVDTYIEVATQKRVPDNVELPHYMLALQRNSSPERRIVATVQIPETPVDVSPKEVPKDLPGYMRPLQRHNHSPERTTEVVDESRAEKKFGVTLRRTDSGRMVQVTNERRRSSAGGINGQTNVEEIEDLEVLEKMMDKVVGYEQRRRIRSQIRVVKKLVSDHKTAKAKKVSKSPAREHIAQKPYEDRREPKRSSVSPSKTTGTPVRHSSPDPKQKTSSTYTSVTTTKTTKERSVSPDNKKKIPTSNMYKPDLKKTQPTVKTTVVVEDKPSWVTNRNLKKTENTEKRTVTNVTSSKKVENVLRRSPSPLKDSKPTDCITSSYGIGPTDENGLPLFGIRALRKAADTKVQIKGSIVTSQFYSENGQEPVGEVTVTKYSNNPKELNIDDEQINKTKGIASITTTQKFGTRGTPTLSSLVDKKKAITDKEEDEILKTTSNKVTRRGSVKALSQKFIENAVESIQKEKQSYPKAGLILRTSSFKETTNNDRNSSSRESSPGYTPRPAKVSLNSITSDSHSTIQSSTEQSRTFLNSHTKVANAQEVITRMRNAETEHQEGDSAEDREARMLLNKFLGAQVLMSGMEPLLSTQSTTVSSSTSSSSAQLVRKVQKKTVTSSSKETSKPLSLTKRYQTPITPEILQDIWDEQTLRALLEQCTDYEERRAIRARLRQVMAEQEAVANVVASAASDTSQERFETTKTTFSEGPVTTTQVSTTRVVQQSRQVSKPMSPFAKFRQLDKQNSLNTPPSSPRTPTGTGGPMFKFTDPALSQSASTVKERLLHWAQMKTKEYQNIKLDNFSTSWADGMAFCALIHHFLPDAFDYHALNPKQRRHNFTLAFKVADEQADIAPLLDVDDMVAMRRPDWKCVFTYVQSIYRRFKDED